MQWQDPSTRAGLSALAWMAAGGEGQPPPSVVTTFALALSAFTFQALAADFDYGPEEVARFHRPDDQGTPDCGHGRSTPVIPVHVELDVRPATSAS